MTKMKQNSKFGVYKVLDNLLIFYGYNYRREQLQKCAYVPEKHTNEKVDPGSNIQILYMFVTYNTLQYEDTLLNKIIKYSLEFWIGEQTNTEIRNNFILL